MIMQWRFTSKATKPSPPLPAKTSICGAQEHATKKPPPACSKVAPEHASDNEPDFKTMEEIEAKEIEEKIKRIEEIEATEREADEKQMSEESKDEIRSIGFALANSLALLPEFSFAEKAKNCTEVASVDTMRNVCSEEDIQAFTYCMESFFLKRPVLQSTASTSDGRPALILKSTEEIKASWTNILERRRLFEPDDTVEINDPDGSRLKRMYADWFRDFQEYELTEEQKLKPHSKQTSAFTAYLKNNFGGKAFIMALWQTGITWAPTRSMEETNYNGALEHVARNFGLWAQRIIRARKLHQEDPKTKEAQRRSGLNTGKHGLSEEEIRIRDARNKTRVDYYWTQDLNRQVLASKGKGKAEGKGRRKRKSLPPKAFEEMTRSEQSWLRELWSGRLRAELERAEKLCSGAQAKDFNVFDYD